MPGSHLRRFFALLVGCLWITTASLAEHVSAEFPFCQPSHSPCCPQPVNNSNESCPACHISVTVALKENGQQERQNSLARTRNKPSPRPTPPVIASFRELTPGIRYRPAIFDLKDDLRV